MVNHPNRSQKSIDALLRRLLGRHSLHRIEVIVTRDGVTAVAHPDSFNPIVAKRREDALAKIGADVTLPQASEVQSASMAPVARASAKTAEEAAAALERALA